jgi:hypothetical protein
MKAVHDPHLSALDAALSELAAVASTPAPSPPLPGLNSTPTAMPISTAMNEVVANQSTVLPPSLAAVRPPPRLRRLLIPTMAVKTSGITAICSRVVKIEPIWSSVVRQPARPRGPGDDFQQGADGE